MNYYRVKSKLKPSRGRQFLVDFLCVDFCRSLSRLTSETLKGKTVEKPISFDSLQFLGGKKVEFMEKKN